MGRLMIIFIFSFDLDMQFIVPETHGRASEKRINK